MTRSLSYNIVCGKSSSRKQIISHDNSAELSLQTTQHVLSHSDLEIIAIYRIVYSIVSYRIVSYRIVSYRIVSYRIVSYRIVSYRIVSYRIVSYRIVSYRIVSPHMVSYIVGLLYRVVSCCIISYCILSVFFVDNKYHYLSLNYFSEHRLFLILKSMHVKCVIARDCY